MQPEVESRPDSKVCLEPNPELGPLIHPHPNQANVKKYPKNAQDTNWSFWNGSKTRKYGDIADLETKVKNLDSIRQSVQGQLEEPALESKNTTIRDSIDPGCYVFSKFLRDKVHNIEITAPNLDSSLESLQQTKETV